MSQPILLFQSCRQYLHIFYFQPSEERELRLPHAPPYIYIFMAFVSTLFFFCSKNNSVFIINWEFILRPHHGIFIGLWCLISFHQNKHHNHIIIIIISERNRFDRKGLWKLRWSCEVANTKIIWYKRLWGTIEFPRFENKTMFNVWFICKCM